MDDLKNLKPCPFCGSKDLKISKIFSPLNCEKMNGHRTSVTCENCAASGPNMLFNNDIEKSWNERNILITE